MMMVTIIMLTAKVLINVYTYATLPYYYFSQKPWLKLNKAQRCRTRLVVPTDAADSHWVRDEPELTHSVMRPTVTEILNNLVDYHGPNTPILAYREILSVEELRGSDGKARRVDGRPLRQYRLSGYKWLTYGRVDTITTSLARGLAANGAHFQDRILILSETRLEWFLCAQAVAKLGACIVTLSPNLSDEGIAYGINQTEIKLMIVSRDLVPKIQSLIDKIPTVRTIIYMNGNNLQPETKPNDKQITDFPDTIHVLSMQELELNGAHWSEIVLKTPAPDDPFIIIYTSGTTGAPKAAVATHRQMVNGSANGWLSLFKEIIADGTRTHTYVAFLPLCHVFELTIEFFLYYVGVKIGYATTFTLTESGPGLAPGERCDISLLRPTVMICVPLMLDRIAKGIGARLSAQSSLSAQMFAYIMAYKSQWTQRGYRCPIVNKLVCSKLRQQMGGQLKLAIVGSAPLSPTTQATIKAALDIVLVQGYAATETLCAGLVPLKFTLELGLPYIHSNFQQAVYVNAEAQS
ncbi:unnamed protein product [Medioppia subpectinata]|uniref:long-chain-fatty-acid--CoA ligase n=1 Tax=Medioppia subpectinata TaxID=1979941 RepID=A0A7R9L0B9_9ACAR|nr:unnamed protein product [Medioppia subpectinata]CAG2113004.1 unnamed protein product [Medioppia subpectinata]